MDMRFCKHVTNLHKNKNLERLILNLLLKVGFGSQKTNTRAKYTFSSKLDIVIFELVKHENVRFARHLDIKVSYKILQLEVPKLVPILHY